RPPPPLSPPRVPAPRLLAVVLVHRGDETIALGVGSAQGSHRRPDEEQEGDDRGDRITGQAEDERLGLSGSCGERPKPSWLARTQRNPPEMPRRSRGMQRAPNVVVRSDRHTA